MPALQKKVAQWNLVLKMRDTENKISPVWHCKLSVSVILFKTDTLKVGRET